MAVGKIIHDREVINRATVDEAAAEKLQFN